MIDLLPFCSTDETRWYLMKPFSIGEYSYATNGHIEIRQPRRDDVPELDEKVKKFNADKPFDGLDAAIFSRLEADLPPAPAKTGPCQDCEGRGHDHACPDCECICESCNGTGDADPEKHISTSIGGIFFGLNYVRQMLALPGVEVANTAIATGKHDNWKPLLFRFDGGVGALMPRKEACKEHIEIEHKSAA